MHYLIKSILALSILCMISSNVSAQDQTTAKPSPYDLMSKYYNDDFKPFAKGSGYLGLAFSLQDQALQNTQRLFDKVIDGNELNYNIELKGGYFIRNYVMVGVNFNYDYQKFTGNLVIESDTVRSESISKRFTVVPVIKPYFPVSKNERLSFFLEMGAGFGGGNGLTRDTKNEDEVTKSETSEFIFTVGMTPGITFFAMENFAFEVGINVIGYNLRRTETVTDESEKAIDVRHNVNLNLNLLSLKLGLAYYF